MAKLRVRDQHAGEERAEAHRQAQGLHQQARAQDEQQRRGREQLRRFSACHEAKYRPQRVVARQHIRDENQDDAPKLNQHFRVGNDLGIRGERRRQREHRHDGDVLEQQDRERCPAVRLDEFLALSHQLQHECGARQRQRTADHDRNRPVATGEARGNRDGRGRNQHLQRAETEQQLAEHPQPGRLQLEADDEQQEHDADLGEVQDVLGIADESDAERADHEPGAQVAEYVPKADEAKDRHDNRRRGEKNRRLRE